MENIHLGDLFDKYRFDSKYYFIGFATVGHPSIKNPPPQIIIKTIKSGHRDACDILMIGFTAQLIVNVKNVVIVTGDHFGPGLVDYIHSCDKNINANHAKTIEELVAFCRYIK